MWKFLKSHWIMSLIGLVILLMVVTTLIYAIATREGDIGLLEGTTGKGLRWKTTPITCVYDLGSSMTAQALEMYDSARKEINSQFSKDVIGACVPWALKRKMPEVIKGELVLNLGPPSPPAEGVTVYDPFESKAGGTTYLHEDDQGFIGAAQLYMVEVSNRKVWLHELGHVMGLAHDRRMDSIMYPSLNDRGIELSSKDIKLLREAYE
ncbi:MAG: matrixin family metalloprotease [Candidatus Eisenbacteria sp.]|nr:matrixin family metalloprotease [Candidatus Eisenbacteria bacterium]